MWGCTKPAVTGPAIVTQGCCWQACCAAPTAARHPPLIGQPSLTAVHDGAGVEVLQSAHHIQQAQQHRRLQERWGMGSLSTAVIMPSQHN